MRGRFHEVCRGGGMDGWTGLNRQPLNSKLFINIPRHEIFTSSIMAVSLSSTSAFSSLTLPLGISLVVPSSSAPTVLMSSCAVTKVSASGLLGDMGKVGDSNPGSCVEEEGSSFSLCSTNSSAVGARTRSGFVSSPGPSTGVCPFTRTVL